MSEPRDADLRPALVADRPSGWRAELRSFAELLALSGLAFAQPLLDVFGRAPDQFIFRGADRVDVIAFALIVVLAPPLVAHLVELAVGLVSRRARELAHETFIGLFGAAFLALVLDLVLPRIAALVLAVPFAALFVLAHRRTRGARVWLAFLSPAPAVFAVIFLLASQVSPLLRESATAHDLRVGNPTPTVVVLFDELPLVALLDADGTIDADLFPNFARLADTSHWFRQTTTVSNFTWTAAPALLTGTMPRDGTTPDSTAHPDNLFTLVGGTMPVVSSEVVSRMCPASVCERLDADTGGLRALLGDALDVAAQQLAPTVRTVDPMSRLVEAHEPAAASGDGEFDRLDGDRGRDRFQRFVDRLGTGEPGLHHLHLLLPHSPYRILPDGTAYDSPEPGIGRFFDGWVPDPEPVRVARQQFLLQLQWTDALLGRIIDRLVDTGTWDDTNLVVIADHGFGFEPGGPVRAMGGEGAEDDRAIAELLWVPFLLKTAGQHEGRISDDPVRIVDLVPTLAQLLEVEIPWEVDGRSALDGGSGDPDEVGLYLTDVDGEDVSIGPHRTLDRARGFELLMERTTGAFAPASPEVTGSDRIHRVGPRPELWGRPVSAEHRPLEVRVHDGSRADDVDRSSGRVPALFRASASEADIGRDVAIAVDGVVRATATVHRGDGAEIVAILPADAFVDGSNTLAVHVLTDAHGADGADG